MATDDDVDVPGIMDLLSVMNNRALKMHFSVIAPIAFDRRLTEFRKSKFSGPYRVIIPFDPTLVSSLFCHFVVGVSSRLASPMCEV